MKEIKAYLTTDVTGDLKQDITELLVAYQYSNVASHSIQVAEEAECLCIRYGLPKEWGYTAGLLHDISVIIPNEERVALCQSYQMVVCEAEKKIPMILHQRLSKLMAVECFQIENKEITGAIECHTTLRANPTTLDLILFIADKIQWDQADSPPYLAGLLLALETSLESAALYFINWMFAQGVLVKHPWAVEAQLWLEHKFV